MKSIIKLVMVVITTSMVGMTLGAKDVHASKSDDNLKEAQMIARGLYGAGSVDDSKKERVFMNNFKEQDQVSTKGIKDKEVKKTITKLNKLVISIRYDLVAEQKADAKESLEKFIEKDYEKTLDILYNK